MFPTRKQLGQSRNHNRILHIAPLAAPEVSCSCVEFIFNALFSAFYWPLQCYHTGKSLKSIKKSHSLITHLCFFLYLVNDCQTCPCFETHNHFCNVIEINSSHLFSIQDFLYFFQIILYYYYPPQFCQNTLSSWFISRAVMSFLVVICWSLHSEVLGNIGARVWIRRMAIVSDSDMYFLMLAKTNHEVVICLFLLRGSNATLMNFTYFYHIFPLQSSPYSLGD